MANYLGLINCLRGLKTINIYKAGKYFNDVRNRSANDLDQTNEFDEMFVSIDANVRIRSVT